MKNPVWLLIIVLIFFTNLSYSQTSAKPLPIGFRNGHIGNKIYEQRGRWIPLFTLPFTTDSGYLCMKDRETILFSGADSLFYYNIPAKTVSKVNGRQSISNFVATGIKRIIFDRGGMGCFGGHKNVQVYDLRKNRFELVDSINKMNSWDSTASSCPKTIKLSWVEEFLKTLPAIYNKQVSIDELAFTKAEYDSCKHNILKYKASIEGEKDEKCCLFSFDGNTDFKKMIALVDSVKTIDRSVLNGYYYSQENVSTASHWSKITFINNKSEELEIKSEEFLNGFHFPWHLKLNDLYSINTAIEINQFLNKVYPEFLVYNKKLGDRRVNAIQEFVKLLYQQGE